MEEEFFSKVAPNVEGSLLYESSWKGHSEKQAETVYIY